MMLRIICKLCGSLVEPKQEHERLFCPECTIFIGVLDEDPDEAKASRYIITIADCERKLQHMKNKIVEALKGM